jgi:Spy/CpxP family protein refolding chaperone
MTKMWTIALLAVTLAAVPASAQRGARTGDGGPMMGGDPARRLERLATLLDLTDAQKTAAQTIFSTAKTQAQPIAASLREAHQAVQTAVKENKSDSEIETLTARSGALMGQVAAIHAKAERAFLQLLTTQQREKLEALHPHAGPMRRPQRRQP